MARRHAKARKANTPETPTRINDYLADPRLRCCLSAAAELSVLLHMVQESIGACDDGRLKDRTRAILVRAIRLCHTVQDGLGDEMITTEAIDAVIRMRGEGLSEGW